VLRNKTGHMHTSIHVYRYHKHDAEMKHALGVALGGLQVATCNPGFQDNTRYGLLHCMYEF
jgi:hypothetical protein